MIVAFDSLWFLYVTNDERVQFKLDSKFLRASEALKLTATSSDKSAALQRADNEALRNWDQLQSRFGCCGITSHYDWPNSMELDIIPDSCGESDQEKKNRRRFKEAVDKFFQTVDCYLIIAVVICLVLGFVSWLSLFVLKLCNQVELDKILKNETGGNQNEQQESEATLTELRKQGNYAATCSTGEKIQMTPKNQSEETHNHYEPNFTYVS